VLMGLLKTDELKLEIGTYGSSPPGKNYQRFFCSVQGKNINTV
jgi:hypothetical protein